MSHVHQLRHRHFGRRQADEVAEADVIAARQVISVVFVTASPTFTGAIGGYTTLNAGDPVNQQSSQSSPSSVDDPFATLGASISSSIDPSTTSTPSPQSSAPSSSSISSMMTSAIVSSATSLVTSVSQSTSSPTIAGGAVAENTASSTAQASPSTVQTGMSAGAKAGLAIGVLLAIAAVAVGVLFLYGKKKKALEEEEKSHNEKAGLGVDAAPMAASLPDPAPLNTSNTGSSAPMLDLRPMSRLMPELMGQRRSQGNLLNTPDAPKAAAPPGTGQSLAPPQGSSPWERRLTPLEEKTENPFADPTNPFGDEQAKAAPPSPSIPVSPVESASMPAPLNIRSAAPMAAAGAAVTGAAVAATTAVATTAVAATAAAKPTGNPASNQSAITPQGVAGAVAGPGGPPNNVHCVQLDFKPSMEDELELRSGQLVRILHEYDDGWALCIRLDRSQQGVAPRSCLSPKPVKPRPMNNDPRRPGPRDPRAPLGPNSRPMTPNGGPPRPMSPARGPGSRPMSPARGPGSRPMSPARVPGSRPMTPTGRPGSRPMTPNGAPGSRPMTPSGGPGHRLNGPPTMSPAGGSRMRASSSAAPPSRPISPSSAPFNLTPRPLSPGPIAGSSRALRPQQQRSMSPGPYGGAPKPGKMVAANQRRRSNSASALDVRERRNTPPGPSPLSSAAPPGWVPPRRPVASDAGASQS